MSTHTSQWTIGRRITVGFSSVLAIVAIIGALSFYRVTAIDHATRGVVDTALPAISLLGQIQSLVKENFINVTQHVISGNDARMKTIESEMTAKSEQLTALYASFEKLITSPEETSLYQAVKAARGPYRDARTKVLALSREHKDDAARQLLEQDLYAVYRTYLTALQAMIDHNNTVARGHGAAAQAAVRFTKATLLIGVSIALLVAVAVSFAITRSASRILRNISHELAEGSRQLTSAASAISASSQSLAQGASEQAASLQQTNATLETIGATTRQNATHAATGKNLATETRTAAENGAAEMAKMKAAMDAIKASGDRISKIIKTIDEIAFQTNILALNAAVEAARAGEAGMGFAIVAEEVRSLAQRSAAAARETAESIADSLQKSEHGVSISNHVAGSFGDIVTRVREVDTIIAEIASASAQQSENINVVLSAASEMDKVTQNIAASAEETASASEELNAQAISVDSIVDRLLLFVSRAPAQSAPASAASPAGHTSPVRAHATAHAG